MRFGWCNPIRSRGMYLQLTETGGCQELDELTAEDQQLMSKKPSKNSKEEAPWPGLSHRAWGTCGLRWPQYW